MTSQLPERPNLEQLKRQAKDLLHAAASPGAAARHRFRVLPAFADQSDAELARAAFRLHDAQSVIAREHGFASWNQLREHVEAMTLTFGAAVDEFINAATSGRPDRAAQLLALFPKTAGANLHTALLLGDAAAVDRIVSSNPASATEPGGPRQWPALLYLCHSCLARTPETQTRAAAIAQRLLASGANPNGRYPWQHHGVQRPVLWAACCVAANRGLAKVLLDAGANPNDGVTLTLAASGSDIQTLELLRAHGANPNHPWATDGSAPLYAILTWSRAGGGPRWLLEHGADPDPVFALNDETPLHQAAARWDVELVALLVERGADPRRRRRDGRTPYAVAVLNNNRAVADWLRAYGAADELSDVDRLVATARSGDRVGVEAMLAQNPALPSQITPEHYVALHEAAEVGDERALEAMLACGFDPDLPDASMGKTALHSAAHEGRGAAVRVLLARGASPHVTDREFHGTPLLWAADGARNHRDRLPEFDQVAQMLMAAGSSLEWQRGSEPDDNLIEVLERWRQKAAGPTAATADA